MNKNAKMVIFTLLFIIICLCFAMFFNNTGSADSSITGDVDNKCDYCGKTADICHESKEYCESCFQEYDGII